jgi:sugar phosphate isomerase/epimerase
MRAVDLTAELGATVVGTPLGGMTHRDAYDPERRGRIWELTLDAVARIAEYAGTQGMEKLVIEPVPVETEFPYDPNGSRRLVDELSGKTAVPVELLLDWGHVLYEPLLKGEADMDVWLERCGPYVDSFHLQQTDGSLDGHWSFTKDGALTREHIDAVLARHGLSDRVQYLELIYPFEYTDDYVLEDVRRSVNLLRG